MWYLYPLQKIDFVEHFRGHYTQTKVKCLATVACGMFYKVDSLAVDKDISQTLLACMVRHKN